MVGPEVSIGICARNSEGTIGLTIESVARQSFPHHLMEIVFVDDGSEDCTLKIVQLYASRIDVPLRIFSSSWRGLGKARNTVINNALGGYIIWLDSDETIETSFVEKQIGLMNKHPKAGIGIAKLGLRQGENPILQLELIPDIVEYSRQDLIVSTKLPGTGGATYRTEAARKVGGFDESIVGAGEDLDISRRIKQAGWTIIRGDGEFFESHGQLFTWKKLWNRYVNQGIHLRKLYGKNHQFFSLYRMNPIASLLASIAYSVLGYKKTKMNVVLLLPVHFTFKMTAWFYGFSLCS